MKMLQRHTQSYDMRYWITNPAQRCLRVGGDVERIYLPLKRMRLVLEGMPDDADRGFLRVVRGYPDAMLRWYTVVRRYIYFMRMYFTIVRRHFYFMEGYFTFVLRCFYMKKYYLTSTKSSAL